MSGPGFLERLLEGAAVEWVPLGNADFFEIANNARRPVKASLREGGNIPYYGANNIQDYVNGYTHEGEYALIAEDGSASLEHYSVQYASGPFWANNHVHVVRGRQSVNTRYLFHYLRVVDFNPFLSGGGRAKLTKGRLVEIGIPIPCPDDPKKSLAIQAEIVRILDAFTELTAELGARKKQYKHYRDQFLSFEGCDVEWKTLGELVTTVTAPSKVKRESYRPSGKYPIIDQGQGFIAGYTDAALKPVASGKYIIFGDHSEHIKYVDFAFIQGADGLKLLKSKCAVSKYIYYAFENYYRREQNYKRHWSSAKETLLPIPFPDDPQKSLAEQARIVAILGRFDRLTSSLSEGLPREIALRQKQYEYYRGLLLNFPKPAEVVEV